MEFEIGDYVSTHRGNATIVGVSRRGYFLTKLDSGRGHSGEYNFFIQGSNELIDGDGWFFQDHEMKLIRKAIPELFNGDDHLFSKYKTI